MNTDTTSVFIARIQCPSPYPIRHDLLKISTRLLISGLPVMLEGVDILSSYRNAYILHYICVAFVYVFASCYCVLYILLSTCIVCLMKTRQRWAETETFLLLFKHSTCNGKCQ